MKKIYILNWGNVGGAPKMGHHLAQALTDLGLRTEIFCLKDLCKYSYILSLSAKTTEFKQRELILHDTFSKLTPGWVIINSCVNAFAIKPLQKLGFKVILYFHEGPGELSSLAQGRFFNYDFVSCADLRIHASYLSYNFISSINFSSQKKPFDILLEPFSALPSNDINSFSVDDKSSFKFDFGVFGTACKRKGFDRFVDLAQKLPSKTFLWGGDLSSLKQEGLDAVLSLANNLENIKLCGHVDPSFFYSSIRALLHLCREDPSPLTSWEAASLRIPQIAFSHDIGNPHLIASNGCLLSGSYSEKLLVQTIELGHYLLLTPYAGSKHSSRTYKNFVGDVKTLLIPSIV